MSNDLRADDADIDALMGSVVGGNGQVVEFPSAPERAAKKRGKAAASAPSPKERVEELSAELATELEANETRPVIDPRTVPVRFSNLKHMARSPLHYKDAVQLDREDTLAMRLGRGAHAMVLGEPVVKWTGKTRNGKVWEAFKERHKGAEILNANEWAKAEGIANAIRRHPIAAPLLFEGGAILEQTVEWEWLGRKCTSRPDSRVPGLRTTDLKTTQCADPARFRSDAFRRAYHAQLAFYALADKHLTGKEPTDLFACAVESKRPFAVQVFQLTDADRIAGERMCRLWMERLLACEASNHWPAYTDAIVAFDAPTDGDPDAAIDLDALDEELWA